MKHAQNPRTRTTKNAKVNKRKMTREEIEKKKKRIIKTFIIILIVFILSNQKSFEILNLNFRAFVILLIFLIQY